MKKTRGSTARRVLRVAPVLLLLFVPLRLTGQSAQNAPTGWADEIIRKEGFVSPPSELAEAVLAPRHLNVSLSNASPDKKWFLDEIGDGSVLMKTCRRVTGGNSGESRE